MTDEWWKIYELGRQKVIQKARISPSTTAAQLTDAGTDVILSDASPQDKRVRLEMVTAWLGDLREFQRERLRMN